MKLNPGKVLLAAFVFAAIACAQGKRPSPPEKTAISLGGHEITINYSAPSVKGRKIWGGLVPYGQVWRLGANEATSLSTAADIQMSFPVEGLRARGGLDGRYPNLLRFLEAIHARPAYQRALERGGPYELLR